jgi:lipopolysaccharide transport system ATP-binding protein
VGQGSVAVRVEGLGKRYRLGGARAPYYTLRETLSQLVRRPTSPAARRSGGNGASSDDLWALRDVSFDVPQGQVLGIIGRNGAGKSTLLKVLSRITEPTVGRTMVRGRVGSLLEVGTGFHPELTGRENILLNGAILGMSRADISRRFDEIVDFAEVERFIDTPVKHYSTGMYMRLAFSVAAHLEPEVLVVDEVLAVGDAQFQRKCLGAMSRAGEGGRTVLFVSHNMSALQSLCRLGLLLEGGRLTYFGSATEAIDRYLGEMAMHGQMHVDLTRHPGRPSAMRPILQSLTARSAHDHVRTGEDLTFEIGFDTGTRELDLAVLAINSARGERVATVGTHLSPRFDGVLRGRGTLECRLPQLPLAEGDYRVFVGIGTRMPMQNVDMVEDALQFRVELGDYFGTGGALIPGQGYLALRSDWTVRPPTEGEPGIAEGQTRATGEDRAE